MRYEKFEKRMKRLRTFRNGLFHLRFVFLGVALLGVAAGASVMGCTGVIQEAGVAKNSYEYGEDIKLEGNAFLSNVVYEYAKEGSDDWSTTKPVRAGNYQYRYYTTNTFGGKRYSDVNTFEIAARPITLTVSSSEVRYGYDPKIDKCADLYGADHIVSKTFTFDSFASKSTDVCVDKASVVIHNENDEDVTSCYEINTPKRHISFIPRVLDVHFKGATKIYDGTALTNDEDGVFDKGQLAYQDTITFGKSLELTDTGTLKNLRTVTVLNKDGVDVTHLYTVNPTADELEVKSRDIIIRSLDIDKVYDGELAEQEWVYTPESNEVLPQHELKIKWNNPNVWKFGKHPSSFIAEVVDKETQKPVKDNLYNIQAIQGNVNISKRPITIKTGSGFKYYDGMPLTNNELFPIGLADKDILVASKQDSYPSITDEGEIVNKFDFNILRNGEDVTDCYDIQTSYGTLEVLKRPLTIDVSAVTTKEYDGKPLNIDGRTLTAVEDDTSKGLAPSHKIVVSSSSTKEMIDAGVYELDNFSVAIKEYDESGNVVKDVTDFYKITYQGNTKFAEIKPRRLTYQTNDITKEYDGKIIDDLKPMVIGKGLAEGDHFDCIRNDNIVDATLDKEGNSTSVPNIYQIVIRNEAGKNVTDNYERVCVKNGDITINRPTVVVAPKSCSKDYDDRAYDESNAELKIVKWEKGNFNNLNIKVFGHVTSNQVDVTTPGHEGNITIKPNTPIRVVDVDNDRDITKNFNIIVDSSTQDVDGVSQGLLTVDPLPLQLKVLDKFVSLQASGELDLSSSDVKVEGLVFNHYLDKVTFDYDKENLSLVNTVGISDYTVYSPERSKDVSNNYYCDNKDSGTISARYDGLVNIKSVNVSKTYDGNYLSFRPGVDDQLVVSGLLPGHSVVAEFDNQLENTYKNVFDAYGQKNSYKWKIMDLKNPEDPNDDVDVTPFYSNVDAKFGDIDIKPRTIKVRTRGRSLIYDGNEKEIIKNVGYATKIEISKDRKNTIYISEDGLLPGEKLYLSGDFMRTNPGKFNIFDGSEFIFSIENSMGQAVDISNYEIINDDRSGDLTIIARPTTFTTQSWKSDLPFTSNNPIYGELAPGHYWDTANIIMKDYSNVYSCNEQNVPLSNVRILDSTHFDAYGNPLDVTDCYNITFNYGQVVINYY